MPRIDALGRLRAGDVVAHNSGAIAIVTECNPDHCELAWLRATDRPARLSADELDAHTLALPGSFRHRVAIENEALEQDLRRRPKAVAEQLLDTLDRPATGADLRRMLVSAAVCSPKEADTWWNALVRQLEQGSQAPLGWDGHALSLTASEETGTTLATRFSRALPEARYTLWSGLGPTERDALMTEVIASGDSAAAATVVRLAASVSPVQATALRERVAQGDARLGAAAVLWGETVGVETILAQGAGHRKHRPLIRRVFDHVPVPLQERLAVRLLADTVTDDEPAALFLVDLLPSGTVPVLRRLDSLVPDDTRKDIAARLLPVIEAATRRAGVSMTVWVATGKHPPPKSAPRGALIHDALGPLRRVGVTPAGTEVSFPDGVLDADLRILLGEIRPHYFAGYAGGAKMLFPGVAGESGIWRNHQLKAAPGARLGQVDGNPCRADMEAAAAMADEAPRPSGGESVMRQALLEHP